MSSSSIFCGFNARSKHSQQVTEQASPPRFQTKSWFCKRIFTVINSSVIWIFRGVNWSRKLNLHMIFMILLKYWFWYEEVPIFCISFTVFCFVLSFINSVCSGIPEFSFRNAFMCEKRKRKLCVLISSSCSYIFYPFIPDMIGKPQIFVSLNYFCFLLSLAGTGGL
jgi:hypothetical protein